MSEFPVVRLSEVIEALDRGVTRCVGDTGYNAQIGSIEEMYGLSKTDVKELFKHEKLKGRRVKTAPKFRLVDDLDSEGNVVTEEQATEPDGSPQETNEISEAAIESPVEETTSVEENRSVETPEF